jgi:hypothetical protein
MTLSRRSGAPLLDVDDVADTDAAGAEMLGSDADCASAGVVLVDWGAATARAACGLPLGSAAAFHCVVRWPYLSASSAVCALARPVMISCSSACDAIETDRIPRVSTMSPSGMRTALRVTAALLANVESLCDTPLLLKGILGSPDERIDAVCAATAGRVCDEITVVCGAFVSLEDCGFA